MEKKQAVSAGIAFVLAITFSLHGQVAVPEIPAGTVSLSATNIRTVRTLSDAQLGELLDVLSATPTIAVEDLPRGGMVGTFYSLAHPNWPPLPADIRQIPVWNISLDSGASFYLLDDLDYPESSAAGGMMVMDAPLPPGFGNGGTNGGGSFSLSFQSQVFTTNDLWLQIIGTTNTGTALTAYLVIHTPWNVTNGVFSLYFKTNLAIPYNWKRLLRCAPGQTNLVASNLPPKQGFFSLGPSNAIRAGFDQQSLGPNDDDYTGNGSSGNLLTNLLATIGFSINFFGTSYTNLYVNNNGNVTFDSYLSEFRPNCTILAEVQSYGLDGMIAPFWADVDTRGSGSGVTTYGTNTVDGRAAFGVNWIDVGYYYQKADKLNSFQLVLIDRSDRTNGDFDLEFNYAQIQWESGSASGGSGGLGGYSARAGYASASGSTFELDGSGTNGAFLDSNSTTGLIYSNFNSIVPGRYVFQFHNGVPLGTP